MRLTERQLLTIAVVVFVLLLAVMGGLIYYVNDSQISPRQEKISQLKKQVQDLERKKQRIPGLRRDVAKLKQEVEQKWERRIPSTDKASTDEFIIWINKLAREARLVLVEAKGVRSRPEVRRMVTRRAAVGAGGRCEEWTYKIEAETEMGPEEEVRANFFNAGRFIYMLETGSWFVRVDSFKLVPRELKVGREEPEPTMLPCTLTLTATAMVYRPPSAVRKK
jgi:hypothetical protein